MKNSDAFVFQLGAFAGILATLSAGFFFLLWSQSPDYASSAVLSVIFIFIDGGGGVLYWYAMARLGTRYKNSLLHWAAVIALIASISFDASSLLFTYSPTTFLEIQTFYYPIFGIVIAIGAILAGFAFFRLQEVFGSIAQMYAVASLVAGAVFLTGIGSSSGNVEMIINTVLYLLGAGILFSASRSVRA